MVNPRPKQRKHKMNLTYSVVPKMKMCSKKDREILKRYQDHLKGAVTEHIWENTIIKTIMLLTDCHSLCNVGSHDSKLI